VPSPGVLQIYSLKQFSQNREKYWLRALASMNPDAEGYLLWIPELYPDCSEFLPSSQQPPWRRVEDFG
jgi:hypothetical protein